MFNVMSLRGFSVAAVLMLGLALLVPAPAAASLLSPGGMIYTTPAEVDPTGSLNVVANLSQPFTTAVYTGTLTSMIVKNDASNPYGLDKLTFLYQLRNDVGSANNLHRLTVNNFDSYITDASYQTPATGLVLPTYVDRSAAGDTVGFSFVQAPIGQGGIAPGATTAWLVVQTNSTLWAPTQASVIDGAVASVASYAPTAVPEPGTLALLASVGLGLWFFVRRARRAS